MSDGYQSLGAGALLVALYTLAGTAPALRLAGALDLRGTASRAALAFACGTALVGLLTVALGVLGMPAGWGLPVGAALLSPLAAQFARRARAPASRDVHIGHDHEHDHDQAHAGDPVRDPPPGEGSDPRNPPGPGVRRALAALLIVVVAMSAAASSGLPFRSDGSKFWAPKAREFAQVGADAMPSLHDSRRLGVHRGYPLLVPALLAPAFAAAPGDGHAGPKLVLAAAVAALLLLVHALLIERGPAARGWLCAFLALPLLVSTNVRESLVAGGYADGFTALFLLLAALGVLRVRAVGACPAGLAAAVLGGAALASTKLEGGVELLLLLAAAAVAPLSARPTPATARRGRALLYLGIAALVALAVLPSVLLRLSVVSDPSGFDLTRLADPAQVVARLPVLVAALAGLALDATTFGLLLPLLLLGVLTAPRGPVRSLALALLGGLALFLLVIYLSSNMHAVRHVQTSAHRLVLHWLPVLIVLLAPFAPAVSRPERSA